MNTSTKPILFLIALLDFAGFTMAATVLPHIFFSLQSGMLATISLGVALALYPLGQFLAAPMMGELSDRFGRRPVLLVTIFGTLASTAILALSISYIYLPVFFMARFLAGMFAGNVTVAQASMIDISDSKTKAANISLIQLSLGLAWVFGAPLASVLTNNHLVTWFGDSTPFWFLSLALLLVWFAVWCVLKETHQPTTAPVTIHLFRGVSLVCSAYRAPHYRRIFIIWFLFIGGWAMFLQFLPAFFMLNFGYTVHSVGPLLAMMGGTFAGTQVFISRRVLRHVAAESVIRYAMGLPGVAVLGVAILGMISGQSGAVLHAFLLLFAVSMGFVLPGLLATISNHASAAEQGKVLGIAQAVQAFVTILVTLVGGPLLSINSIATACVGAVLMLLAYFLLLRCV